MTLRTVTFSPGLDHIVHVDHVTPGEVGRVLSWRTVAAGKGVNVARAAHALGVPTTAYSLIGEHDETQFVRLVESAGPRAVTIGVPGVVRNNLTLKIGSLPGPASHAAGPRLATATDAHAVLLLDRLMAEVEHGDVVTFNGAVPEGVAEDLWACYARRLHLRGALVIADAQGACLLALVDSGVLTLAKPNEDEASVLGADAEGQRRAAAALETMRTKGVHIPVVTMGAKGVAHLRQGSLTWSICPVPRPAVVVGAGDAFVAGCAAALVDPQWEAWSPVEVGLCTAAAHVAGERVDVGTVRGRLETVKHHSTWRPGS